MKLYTCSNCKNQLYFENNICLVCGHAVGFDAATLSMITLVDRNAGPATATTATAEPGTNPPMAAPITTNRGPLADFRNKKRLYRWCANAEHGTCNWLIPYKDPSRFCTACRLNRTIPELSNPQNLTRWHRIEIAKHRLVYSLLRLGLPVNPQLAALTPTPSPAPVPPPVAESPAPAVTMLPIDANTAAATPSPGDVSASPVSAAPTASPADTSAPPVSAAATETVPPPPGIAFDFMADISPENRIMTGHANGVITLNIEEADEAERARNKQDLGEKYRTLLGHFRHEIGHYYWDLLIKDSPLLPAFRERFGDESTDYGEALNLYYANGAPANWTDHFISPYASAHPWEDWAETWSHYMHMMDTLETAYAFGIGIHPDKKKFFGADIRRDPYEVQDFKTILDMWLPLTFAVNSLNRSMGHPDFYPFVISATVSAKLQFIHESVQNKKAQP